MSKTVGWTFIDKDEEARKLVFHKTFETGNWKMPAQHVTIAVEVSEEKWKIKSFTTDCSYLL